jgi:hypothetical protein
MPITPGNLSVIPAAQYKNLQASKSVIYEWTANFNGVDNILTFFSDGSAFNTPDVVPYVSTQIAPSSTFTAPSACSYQSYPTGQPGVLIVDPVGGYYDYNVSAANVLTKLSGGILSTSLILATPTAFPATLTGIFVSGAGNSSFLAQSVYTVHSVTINAGGTGYVVGDQLTIGYGSFYTTITTLTVTSIGGGGAITGVSITNGGVYPGQYTGGGPSTGFGPLSPAAALGGTGSGANFTGTIACTGFNIINPGNSYTVAPVIADQVSGVTISEAATALAGNTAGTSIASYAGRVWIGLGRTISYTDVNSYRSFGGAGGSLTITDDYLHANINALYSAFGFLYIFGDDSIDSLSNVQVTAGTTSFSRVNITPSIGTSYPQSIFPFNRSLMFANNYGFFALAGATPQKISDDLDNLFLPGTFITGPNGTPYPYTFIAGSVQLMGQLCMCWSMRIIDSFTTLYGVNTTRTLLLIFFKGKWFFAYPGFDVQYFVSVPANGTQILHAWSTGTNPKLYELFQADPAPLLSFVQTKLWDGDAPIEDKEVTLAGLGVRFGSQVNQTLTVTTDNEFESNLVPGIDTSLEFGLSFVNNTGGVLQFQNSTGRNLNFYSSSEGLNQFLFGAANTMGGKFFGMSVTGQQTDITYYLLAEQYRSVTPW